MKIVCHRVTETQRVGEGFNEKWLMRNEEWAEGFEFGKSRSLSDFRRWFNEGNFRKINFFTHYSAAKIVSAQTKCLFINGYGREECQFEYTKALDLRLSKGADFFMQHSGFMRRRELLVGNGGLVFDVGAEYIQHGCGNEFIDSK